MINTLWKCNQSSYVSCLPAYNSFYRERTGKGAELSISTRKLRQESGELCSLYSSNPAKLADVWCLDLCAATLFVLLLKFGAVLSIMCGFLMATCWWRRILQCIVIVRSFLRLLNLRKLAVYKVDLLGGGSYSVSRCVRPWIKLTPEYPFNMISGLLCRDHRQKF